MYHDFPEQFNTLREEFRLLQSGFRIKTAMAEQALNNSWLATALLNAAERRTETDSSLGSSSSHLSPFKSSDSSHSSVESERAQSEVPTATIVSESDDQGVHPQRGAQYIPEAGESRSDGPPEQQRSRKGHKKSRVGCFNCKRRKIKVRMTSKSMAGLTSS
jgi:hypothetical protein